MGDKWLNNFGHDTRLGVTIEEAMRCCRNCNASTSALAFARNEDSVVEEARRIRRFACPVCRRLSRNNVMPGQEFCSKAGDCRNECRIGVASQP